MYIYRLILIFTFLLTLGSCKVQTSNNSNTAQEKDSETVLLDEGYAKATILVNTKNSDDCKYLIRLTDNQQLETLDFPETFKSDGVKIWIKYTLQRRVNRCGNAQPIEIIDIKKREE